MWVGGRELVGGCGRRSVSLVVKYLGRKQVCCFSSEYSFVEVFSGLGGTESTLEVTEVWWAWTDR